MNANENKYSLDELKVDSFVTTIPEAEQDMIRGGYSTKLCWLAAGWIFGRAADAFIDYVEENSPNWTTGHDTNTKPGFFDGDYTCG